MGDVVWMTTVSDLTWGQIAALCDADARVRSARLTEVAAEIGVVRA